MTRNQENYLYLTVYSEDCPLVAANDPTGSTLLLKEASHVIIELSTGHPDYQNEVNFCIKIDNDDDTLLSQFQINRTVAKYIHDYLETYLKVTAD
jgi:hypothetical protein